MARRRNSRLIWLAVAAAGGLLVAEVWGVHTAHGHSPWHRWPGFDLALGLLGSLGVVLASKILGHFLERPEQYYHREG